ncbi:MAG: hypothetical protein CR982_00925 [Candidatus Cloacimonadota bacterium]|nr:MAG: hypothetical protein CR982_00925 [Candidatus Cloacimonadota bacterium]PIE77773.1 MAG: hypothetical protein CSA15_11325 [Candidatus Delongbacteria bacterium]
MFKRFLFMVLSLLLMGVFFISCSNSSTESSNEAPVITILSPSDSSSLTIGYTVLVKISIQDDGKIEKGDLYLDDQPLTSFTASDYEYNWSISTDLSIGEHFLRAFVRDSEGLTDSSEIGVVLNNFAVNDKMVLVEGGQFQMGDYFDKGYDDETPVHSVELNSFFMGKHEVTQDEYSSLMNSNPSNFLGDNRPVEKVSWYEAIEYCNKLSELEGFDKCYSGSGDDIVCDFRKNGYRLPTEAEWEYAARGGIHYVDSLSYSGCNKKSELEQYSWYYSTSNGKTRHVESKLPNQLGLYDMSGNVWEWCWDWYNGTYYSYIPIVNPEGPLSGSCRVIRGGSWHDKAKSCRVADRNLFYPSDAINTLGFRVVRSAVQ